MVLDLEQIIGTATFNLLISTLGLEQQTAMELIVKIHGIWLQYIILDKQLFLMDLTGQQEDRAKIQDLLSVMEPGNEDLTAVNLTQNHTHQLITSIQQVVKELIHGMKYKNIK